MDLFKQHQETIRFLEKTVQEKQPTHQSGGVDFITQLMRDRQSTYSQQPEEIDFSQLTYNEFLMTDIYEPDRKINL